MSRCFLGVDAGNSKTVALVGDREGRILGRGRGGVGDIYGAESAEAAVTAVLAAVTGALAAAGLRAADVQRAAFRLAGVDWPEDEGYWQQALATRFAGLGPASIKNDGFALLRCGEVSGTGVAITAGTGPAVAARGPDGREYCASWWIQRDLGGGGLGVEAFRAVVDADLGLAPPTALTAELLELFGCADTTALLHAFTRRDHPRPGRDRRAAARGVLRVATAGDPVAVGIVEGQAEGFAGLAGVAARTTGLGRGGRGSDACPVPVVLGGSVLASEHRIYRDALTRALRRRLGAVQVAAGSASPVAGALLDALAEGGVPVGLDLQERVLQAPHPPDFLFT